MNVVTTESDAGGTGTNTGGMKIETGITDIPLETHNGQRDQDFVYGAPRSRVRDTQLVWGSLLGFHPDLYCWCFDSFNYFLLAWGVLDLSHTPPPSHLAVLR